MNALVKTLTLIIGFSCMNISLPMNYNQAGAPSNDFGIWEAQVITYGLTLSAFAYCAWLFAKNHNFQEKLQRRYLDMQNGKKENYHIRAGRGITRNFKRR